MSSFSVHWTRHDGTGAVPCVAIAKYDDYPTAKALCRLRYGQMKAGWHRPKAFGTCVLRDDGSPAFECRPDLKYLDLGECRPVPSDSEEPSEMEVTQAAVDDLDF
jgi:hypothetical protein